jgi:nitrite reductase (NADH) small subunit
MSLLERTSTYTPVCAISRLTADRGVAALVDGTAVALFLLGTGELAVIDNVDPISGANVLSRGLVGDAFGTPTVASPLYKQRFDLRTGQCLDAAGVAVTVHDARICDGTVEVRLSP